MQHTRTNARHIPRLPELPDGPSAAQWLAQVRRWTLIAALAIVGLPAAVAAFCAAFDDTVTGALA